MNHFISRNRLAFFAAGVSILVVAGMCGMLALGPVVSPMFGANMADALRTVLGPRPVAWLEGRSFAVQDALNQFISAHNGGQRAISLAQADAPLFARKTQPQVAVAQGSGSSVRSMPAQAAASDVVTTAPQIGWRALGPVVNGSPAMAETLLSLDPQRPYAAIAVVRIDLSLLKLHMMPGYQEPSHAKDVVASFPHLGTTPPSDLSQLVAGFNGGFKAINGHYGMMVNGVTILPPSPGLATLAIYRDGHVAIGVWGQDMNPSPDMLAFRQNCPPIITNGQINPEVAIDNRSVWGNTVGNKEITWRTAVGITQDGRYLIYAVGNGTTVQTLADALQQANAYNAMQLDINRPFARFVTYQQAGSSLRAVPLLEQMENEPTIYLVPHPRDYFYLTTP
jgi:hypothetical protein